MSRDIAARCPAEENLCPQNVVMIKGTIVLEGGARRGIFTSGVLDYLMEQNVYFLDVIGVSFGACNASSYVSEQHGRMRDCTAQKENNYGMYAKLGKFMKDGSILDMDLLFDKYPNEYFPFDYKTYFQSESECEMVVTNLHTGEAEYLTEREDKERLMKICRASSSMPLLSPIVKIDGKPYLDGGIADSVPIKRAFEKGNEKIVLVLTRNPGYRKKMISKSMAAVYRHKYKKYPEFVTTLIRRNLEYNKQMAMVNKLEAEGKIFVIRPTEPPVGRLEKDYDKLMNFYMHGYHMMQERYEDLKEYLKV